jgi:SAM-dependent methyltransferase
LWLVDGIEHGRVSQRLASVGAGRAPAGTDPVGQRTEPCSVPDPRRSLAELYRVVRPGGQLRFFEHVRSTNPAIRVFQTLITPAWAAVGGGCHLNRDTVASITAAGFRIEDLNQLSYRPLRFIPAHAHILDRAHRPHQPAEGAENRQ